LALGVKYSTQKEHNILTRQFLNLMDVFFWEAELKNG
jgi:hypothetical protein